MARGLLRHARLSRRQLIMFALASAAINGVITATVGAWLAQTYATYQGRRQSIETIAHLVYERRTRAGMVASAIRRDADIEEVRHRKQAYDEAYVDWNKNVMLNLFAIREVAGDLKFSSLEPIYEDHLIAAMADVDRCVTRAYDIRVANGDAKSALKACRMPELHQFVLDCGATFTNELYKLTQLTFIPFTNEFAQTKELANKRITKACIEDALKPTPESGPTPAPVAPAGPPADAPKDAPTAAIPPVVTDPAVPVPDTAAPAALTPAEAQPKSP
jgi:hypothetical protein